MRPKPGSISPCSVWSLDLTDFIPLRLTSQLSGGLFYGPSDFSVLECRHWQRGLWAKWLINCRGYTLTKKANGPSDLSTVQCKYWQRRPKGKVTYQL